MVFNYSIREEIVKYLVNHSMVSYSKIKKHVSISKYLLRRAFYEGLVRREKKGNKYLYLIGEVGFYNFHRLRDFYETH